MCNLEQWTLVDAYGNRFPREKLYPCARATPHRTPCSNVRTYTLNDEIIPPSAPLPGAARPPIKKKPAKDGLRLQWEINVPGPVKKRTPPTPTTPVNAAGQAQVRLDRPLVPGAGPALPPAQQHPLVEPPPQIIQIEPGNSPRNSPPRTPRRAEIIIVPPTRPHERRSSREHHRSDSRYRRVYYQDRDRRRHDTTPRREARREDRRERTPTPVRERRQQAELERTQREARIQAEIDRLNNEIDRRVADRDQARRTRQREEEIRRLDRDIEELREETERQRRAWRAVRPVIHQDDYLDDDDHYSANVRDILRAAAGTRERERSSSRGRGLGVRFQEMGRRLSRSADRGRRRQSYIEDRPRDETPIPVGRGRSVSGLAHGWLPRRFRNERVYEEDADRRGGRRRWF